jgi:hypothetical protein
MSSDLQRQLKAFAPIKGERKEVHLDRQIHTTFPFMTAAEARADGSLQRVMAALCEDPLSARAQRLRDFAQRSCSSACNGDCVSGGRASA